MISAGSRAFVSIAWVLAMSGTCADGVPESAAAPKTRPAPRTGASPGELVMAMSATSEGNPASTLFTFRSGMSPATAVPTAAAAPEPPHALAPAVPRAAAVSVTAAPPPVPAPHVAPVMPAAPAVPPAAHAAGPAALQSGDLLSDPAETSLAHGLGPRIEAARKKAGGLRTGATVGAIALAITAIVMSLGAWLRRG